MEEKKHVKPWQGILFFIFVMTVFFFFMTPLQYYFGIYGVAATEILLLLLSVGFVLLCRADIREVFPVHSIQAGKLAGTFLLWAGGVSLTMAVNIILAYFFPEEILSVGNGLNEVITSAPMAVAVIIVCLLPAVCEEAMHRGVIQSSLQSVIHNRYLILFLMAIIFGLFHADIWRFLPMAMLGWIISYIRMETGNMVYSCVFHGVNNLFPTVLSFLTLGLPQSDHTAVPPGGLPIASVGVYVALSAAAPFALYLGVYLLHRKDPGYRTSVFPEKNEGLIIAVLITATVLLLLTGIGLFFYGLFLVDLSL